MGKISYSATCGILCRSTYHAYSVPDGFGWQVACELGTHHTTVTVSTCDFTPDNTGLIGFPTWGHCSSKDKAQTAMHIRTNIGI